MSQFATFSAQRKVGLVLVLVSGVLLTAGGILHDVAGWPALSRALEAEGLTGPLETTVGIGWVLGGVSMLAMGLMTLLLYSQLRHGLERARPQGFVIGLLFLLFGAGASLIRFPNTHFLSFMGIGALLLLGLWLSRSH